MAESTDHPLKVMNPDIEADNNNEEMPSPKTLSEIAGASLAEIPAATGKKNENIQQPPNTPAPSTSTPEIRIVGPEDSDGDGGVSVLHIEQYQLNYISHKTPSLHPVIENDQTVDPLLLSVPGDSPGGSQRRLPIPQDSDDNGYPLERINSQPPLQNLTPPPAYEEAAAEDHTRSAIPLILLRIPCVRSSLTGTVHFHPLFEWECTLPPPLNLLKKIKAAEGTGRCKIQRNNIMSSSECTGDENIEELWEEIERRLLNIYDKWYLGWDGYMRNGVWAAEWRGEGNEAVRRVLCTGLDETDVIGVD